MWCSRMAIQDESPTKSRRCSYLVPDHLVDMMNLWSCSIEYTYLVTHTDYDCVRWSSRANKNCETVRVSQFLFQVSTTSRCMGSRNHSAYSHLGSTNINEVFLGCLAKSDMAFWKMKLTNLIAPRLLVPRAPQPWMNKGILINSVKSVYCEMSHWNVMLSRKRRMSTSVYMEHRVVRLASSKAVNFQSLWRHADCSCSNDPRGWLC